MITRPFIKAIFNAAIAAIAAMFTSPAIAQTRNANITVDPNKTYQTINNFSASDAWACQFVGNWPDAKRNAIADLLFSTENRTDGSPKGIGLNMWRFNIGAGSTDQGAASGIPDEWHRAESFYDASGGYNFKKPAGQLWFLQAARQRGVKEFLGFTNSPPVRFTINGRAFADKGKVNIAPEKYNDFAGYLADVVKGVEQETKIRFNYISPFNEPQWDWSDNKQEGCPYTNAEIAGAVRVMDKVFTNRGVRSKLIIAEAGQINYLYTKSNKPEKGMQIADFFRPGSANYIGDLSTVAHTITAHSYFTTSPMASSVKMRKALADSVAAIRGLSFWQSEYCILGDNAGDINGNKRDLGMDAALYMASVIHNDLAVTNASAWQWWLAVSAYDYKDGLIYVDKTKADGNFYTSKMLWTLGNYSRFIKPGSVRVAASVSSDSLAKPLMVSAYKKGKELIVVLVNQNTEGVAIDLAKLGFKKGSVSMYTTSDSDDLKLSKPQGNNAPIPARAIVTITGRN